MSANAYFHDPFIDVGQPNGCMLPAITVSGIQRGGFLALFPIQIVINPPSPLLHLQVIQRTLDPFRFPLRNVRVQFGRLDALVPHKLLDVTNVYPIFQQMRRK